MFTAVIVACHIASADMCMTIVDNRGPYDTEDKCKTRISEMAENLIGVWVSFQMPMVFKITSCVILSLRSRNIDTLCISSGVFSCSSILSNIMYAFFLQSYLDVHNLSF